MTEQEQIAQMQIPDEPANEIKSSMLEFCSTRHAKYFLTLNTHRDSADLPWGTKQLRFFQAQIDRKILGSGWSRFPTGRRSSLLAVPEGHDLGNGRYLGLHYHVFFTPADKPFAESDLRALVDRCWKKCVPSGTTDLQPILNKSAVSSYACKRIQDAGSLGARHFTVL